MNWRDTKAPAPIAAKTDEIAKVVVNSAFCVHSELGPGLLESVYENCLSHEIHCNGLAFKRQVPLPILYRDVRLDAGFRLDLLVENCLIVEVKAVEALLLVHHAQMLTYLKLTGIRLGLLINFNVPVIRNGIRRVAL